MFSYNVLSKINSPQSFSPSSKIQSGVPTLLSLLVCPLTRAGLIYDAKAMRLISLQAGLSYPIMGQVPIMLEEAATPLQESERAKFSNKPPPGPAS